MNKTQRLAVALIVKNEEKNLGNCLKSVYEWVDEIVILDSGSSDQTEAIARKYTEKFYPNIDWPGFGKQRQIAQSYITCDYVLWLDADEVVTEELKQSILFHLSHPSENTVFALNRLTAFFGKFIHHSGFSPDWIVRLYPTKLTSYDDALVHEKVRVPKGIKVKKLSGRLHHFTFENIDAFAKKLNSYAKSWADDREGKKRASLFSALLHAAGCFLRMYVLRLGLLDGKHGFILAWMYTNYTFMKYIDLALRKPK